MIVYQVLWLVVLPSLKYVYCWNDFSLSYTTILTFIAVFFLVIPSTYWNIGEPTFTCDHCGALMWYEERTRKNCKPRNPRFSMCCTQGRIVLPSYEDPPQPLHDLFQNKDPRSNFFLDNLRSFNSMFAFTSLGGKVHTKINAGRAPPVFVLNGENYHRMGDLLPLPGDEPKFAQLYIYDTDNEVANRMRVVGYESFYL